ncbi:E3 ubiquitin ligase complex SCF subunit sconC, partial [Basidiobolus meristosporus CBS 931.73]
VGSGAQSFQGDKEVAESSLIVKSMLQDLGISDMPLPLPNVTEAVLGKVIEYCEHYRNGTEAFTGVELREMVVSEWDQAFLKADYGLLMGVIEAASYLNIEPLCGVGCRTLADIIHGRTPQEFRKILRIELEPLEVPDDE